MPLIIPSLDTSSWIFQQNAAYVDVNSVQFIKDSLMDLLNTQKSRLTVVEPLADDISFIFNHIPIMWIGYSVHKGNVIVLKGSLGHSGLEDWSVMLVLSHVVDMIQDKIISVLDCNRSSISIQIHFRSYMHAHQTITDPPSWTWYRTQLE